MRFTQEHETRTVVDGQEYHAQTAGAGQLCTGCAFYMSLGCAQLLWELAAPCTPHERADRTGIIWVKA